jgi:hypothetical protein
MDTPQNNTKLIKAPTSTCNHSFSLGLDRWTLERLKELQDYPEFILKNNRQPSRTLITRQAIRFYAEVISQCKTAKKTDFLESQKQKLEILAHTGKKS